MGQNGRHAVAKENLLKTAFDEKTVICRKVLQLDCYMSVIDMFIGLCKSNSSLYSMAETKRCPYCSHFNHKVYASLPIPCVNLDLSNISSALQFKNVKKCKKCDVDMDIQIERMFSPIAIVDLDGMLNPNTAISEIQEYIMLGEQKYRFCGLIESTGSHFKAHALRSDGDWHTYDDLRPTQYKKIDVKTILHPVLLMYSLTDTQIEDPTPRKRGHSIETQIDEPVPNKRRRLTDIQFGRPIPHKQMEVCNNTLPVTRSSLRIRLGKF